MKNFYRIAAITPRVQVAAPLTNADELLACFREAAAAGAVVIASPELSLTGASCGDLFGSASLEAQTDAALEWLCQELPPAPLCIVGLPLRLHERLYNCAAVIQGGVVRGYVSQVNVPKRGAFEEARHFSSAAELPEGTTYRGVPVDPYLLFDAGAFSFGIEVGDNLWSPSSSATTLIAARAQLLINLAATPETVGAAEERAALVRLLSGRYACTYLYVSAGEGESTTDVVTSGHRLIATNGRLLSEARWELGVSLADMNPRWLQAARRDACGFEHLAQLDTPTVFCTSVEGLESDATLAGLRARPFVPDDSEALRQRCQEILRIQVAGLKKRFTHTHAKRLVLGLSGGLDSTLALLVCVELCKALGLPPTTILAVTMPGFGTSKRTRSNVETLAQELGVELREICIGPQVELHFKDIGHDPEVRDVTYENAQARARTYILMDLANEVGGLLVGTGDLSEIALGWSTYNGDHMSMYSVNCSVPKALVRYCVQTYAEQTSSIALATALKDVCDTPVSPELLPGEQHTETLVGNYDLHDCFLYYFMKYGCTREELRALAGLLWGELPDDAVEHALDVFCRRFVQQQFKRSASPDGPKVGTIALSPRGDWRMPSDAAFLF